MRRLIAVMSTGKYAYLSPLLPKTWTALGRPGEREAWYPAVGVIVERGRASEVQPDSAPWCFQVRPGPLAFGLYASRVKRVELTERFALRFNAVFFKKLNMPVLTLSNSFTGLISLRSSNAAARQMQLRLPLLWQPKSRGRTQMNEDAGDVSPRICVYPRLVV